MESKRLDIRHLRSALEFAVRLADEGQKAKPPLPYPSKLRKYFKESRLPTSSLPAIRRLVEGDDDFRERVNAAATDELVDPIGRIWLERGDRWERRLADAVAEAEAERAEADLRTELKRSEKRREAAERATARAQADLLMVREELASTAERIADLTAEVTKLEGDLASMHDELVETRNDVRHARDREAAAVKRAEQAERDRTASDSARSEAEGVRDAALADRSGLVTQRSELAQLAANAEALAARLATLTAVDDDPKRPAARRALPLPGGVLGSSVEAAEYLLRSGATVLIDGYNVAKLAWPRLDLAGQRVVLLDHLENVARRFGTDLTVVFDGADVTGSSADRRRVVRVMYSPAGILADDVIRDEVERLPSSRSVVVVTNDKEILRDVKAMGANLLASNQLIEIMG